MRTEVEDIHDLSLDIVNREIFLDAKSQDRDCDIDSIIASTFIKNLRILDHKPAPILVHLLAGGGGNYEDGMAIFDAIRFSSSYIIALIYGQSCSMSSIIAQAADYRAVMPNSYMMCHYGYEHLEDASRNIRQWTNLNGKLCNQLISIYAKRMQDSQFIIDKGIKNKLPYCERYITKKLNDGDWYLLPDEMIYYGFADAILGDEAHPTIKSLKDI